MIKLMCMLFLIGCGARPANIFIEEPYEGFVDAFLDEAKQHAAPIDGAGLSIVTSDDDLGPNVVGQCRYTFTKKLIVIKREFWEKASSVQKELLLYHELGHCLLKIRNHDDTHPCVMNSIMISPTFYIQHKKQLLNELFGPK